MRRERAPDPACSRASNETRYRGRSRATARSGPRGSPGARGASASGGENQRDADDLIDLPVLRAAREDLGESDDVARRILERRGDGERALRRRAGGRGGESAREDPARG